jgi:hypothetical protein
VAKSKPDGKSADLTHKQIAEMSALAFSVLRKIGHDFSKPSVWLLGSICIYLGALQLSFAVTTEKEKTRATVGKSSIKLRKQMLSNIEKYLGHPPTADELIAALKEHEAVPKAIAKAIAEDIERLK